MITSTYSAPSNIACIKYWGKRSSSLILPLNSSVSVTLNMNELKSTTTITASKLFDKDSMWLNDEEENISLNKRLISVLTAIRSRAEERVADDGCTVITSTDWPLYKVHIVSHNNFPTAAGLASSASGFACLVATLADVYNFKERFKGELSTLARLGSGSACRSMYGGFVRWNKGVNDDGSDSFATQIADEFYWPDLEAIILVVNASKKETSSTEGMQNSVETSTFLKFRASNNVPGRLKEIEEAYLNRDFNTFGNLTMKDSNEFHSSCLDTFPPIFYLNQSSRDIINIVHQVNRVAGKTVAAYTFDAGPNSVVFVLKENVKLLLNIFTLIFPPPSYPESSYLRSSSLDYKDISDPSSSIINIEKEIMNPLHLAPTCNVVKFIYHTTVGPGPKKVS